MKIKRLAVIAFSTALLTACGGGGGGDSTQQWQGFYQGELPEGKTGWGFAQSNGEFFVIASAANGKQALETVHRGKFTSINGTRAEGPLMVEFAQGSFPFSASGHSIAQGEFRTRNSWKGQINGVRSVPFELKYVNDGVQASSLGQLAGQYASWPVAAATSGTVSTMTIDAFGVMSGSYYSGCNYTGQATATAQANVYDFTLTLSGVCYLFNSPVIKGLMFHDASNARVFAAAANMEPPQNFVDGFMFVGTKF